MTIKLVDLSGKTLTIAKGVSIPIYEKPVFWFSTPTPLKSSTGKPMYYLSSKNGKRTNLTLGELVQYNGVNYYITKDGNLIIANPKYFDLKQELRSGTVKTSQVREKEAEENSFMAKLKKNIVFYSLFGLGSYAAFKYIQNGNKGRKK